MHLAAARCFKMHSNIKVNELYMQAMQCAHATSMSI